MMKRVIYIIFVSVVLTDIISAQQQATFTNFLLNDYFYNPAIAGSKKVHVANLSYRNQWTGFEGAPNTLIGNFYGSIRNEGKHGYGISVLSDKAGLTQNTAVYLNYAYHVKLNKELKLGLGFQPGYMQYRVKLYDARLADSGDDVLTGNVLSANALDLNTGFHLYSNKFFVMGAMQQILGKAIQFTTYNNNLSKHFTMVGGYNIKLDSAKILLQPALLVRYVKPAPTQIGILLKATYDKKYWAGLSYRTSDAMSVCLGYNLKERLSIGYGYDYSVSGIRKFNSGSHEIVISFITTPKKPSLDELDEKLNNRIMDQNKLDIKEKY